MIWPIKLKCPQTNLLTLVAAPDRPDLFSWLPEKSVSISKMEALHISQDDYFKVYSNVLTIMGDYNSIAHTVYLLERDFSEARIASMKFHAISDPRTKRKKLYNTIIFQNYEKNQYRIRLY